MSEWYKDWFNSKYYHILYKDRGLEEAKGFIQKLIDHLEIFSGASVLDLACGRGRHSIFLNELGFDVLGADLSDENISFARQFENERLSFIVHDMRDPIANKKFDAVFNLFTSFGYFDDPKENLKVLTSVASYLKDKGILVIDFFNAEKVIRQLDGPFDTQVDGITFNIEKYFDGQFIYKKIKVTENDEVYEFEEIVQAIKKIELEKMLNEAGFICEEIFGDYNLSNFDAMNSDRLIIKARLG